jgi:carbon starvation protein
MDLFTSEVNGQTLWRAMPILLVVLCVLAIAYRFYSAFLAAKVAMLDDLQRTPAHEFNDGQNYHPTNKWVLFGHHFAAISGAGPLIGPVLAIQYGYMPGLLWLVIGVCLAGAVQDMLVLAASVRRGGKSLAQIALTELGKPASIIVSLAILFIVVIALAGLGFVVVKALGGEEVKLPATMEIMLPDGKSVGGLSLTPVFEETFFGEKTAEIKPQQWEFPEACQIRYSEKESWFARPEAFKVRVRLAEKTPAISAFSYIITLNAEGVQSFPGVAGEGTKVPKGAEVMVAKQGFEREEIGKAGAWHFPAGSKIRLPGDDNWSLQFERFTVKSAASATAREHIRLPADSVQILPGSSWGTFTIACTIPIALFVSFWMYRFRKGRVVEASAIGAVGVLFATVAGGWIRDTPLESVFSLSKESTIFALCGYGFIASVLPVWMLLCPRDYISSFLKIGTIALLVIGTMVANPALPCPPINHVFADGGPTFAGNIFPFVFICIMCGSISGFHALVSSGTTPKMVNKESDVRMIGYGSMLIEGLVGIVALLAAASLPVDMYYDINVDLDKAPQFQGKLDDLYRDLKIDRAAAKADLGVPNLHDIKVQDANLAQMEGLVGGESLRGRTGGAVTLAVGMSRILTQAGDMGGLSFSGLVKYWYHFAIMFEALFILTTIDTGTRIGRFLFQETLGQVIPQFARTDWLPGSILATGVITLGWGVLVFNGSIMTIWPMFGIANQLLAVLALCLVTTLLFNSGRGRYAWVTLIPMAFVTSTTMSAGVIMTRGFANDIADENKWFRGLLNLSLTVFVMASVGFILVWAASRWLLVLRGVVPIKGENSQAPP